MHLDYFQGEESKNKVSFTIFLRFRPPVMTSLYHNWSNGENGVKLDILQCKC